MEATPSSRGSTRPPDDTRRLRGEAAHLEVHGGPIGPGEDTAFRGRAYLGWNLGHHLDPLLVGVATDLGLTAPQADAEPGGPVAS